MNYYQRLVVDFPKKFLVLVIKNEKKIYNIIIVAQSSSNYY